LLVGQTRKRSIHIGRFRNVRVAVHHLIVVRRTVGRTTRTRRGPLPTSM
jgi:hypothetical protein